ncbi:MAG: CotH kinase family protein [Saccharofermentanales bacterium]|jgi:hypothetical protein
MLKHRHIDKLGIAAIILAVIITLLFMTGESLGLKTLQSSPGYASRLFDTSIVHEIDLELKEADWHSILGDPRAKKYVPAEVLIDGERISNVGLRVKGSNSLNQILKYGSKRFSLKIEFDHYEKGQSYHGLDKLSLNSSFQDNAYLKDVMTFDMMASMGVPAPLTSYAFIRINGEDWGLFVAIEEIEDAFVLRNYGTNHGELYKPSYRRLDDDNSDIGLIYTGDEFWRYDNIFRESVFKANDADKKRLIKALQILSEGQDLERAVDIEAVLRYFVVQTFVVNLDSYLGRTGHNYFLYEKDGRISMLPWDYNLAFATYALGMTDPIDDSTLFVNYPIDTPAPFEVMVRRPLFFVLMQDRDNIIRYHQLYDEFLVEYLESGYFEDKVDTIAELISPYVECDPTKFASHDRFLLAVDTFKSFNLLRTQSVRGQLDGTIPATFRGQAENPDARIDASAISVPDMGCFADMRNLVNGLLPEE